MRALPFALILVVACKSSTPAPAPTQPTPPPPPAAEAPAFSGLFAPGASWHFKVTLETSHWDDSDPDADGGGNVHNTSTSELSCKVTATVSFPGGRASEIECDEDADWRVKERIAGTWIQTAEGLWHDSSLPDEGVAPDMDPESRFLPAHPEPMHEDTEDPPSEHGPAMGSGSSVEIEAIADGWCVTNAWWGGDESYTKLCLDSSGPISGAYGFGGAETQDFTFERVD